MHSAQRRSKAQQVRGSRPDEQGGSQGRLTFDEIYEKWFDDVSRWIMALGGTKADLDDLAQDVFVVVYRRLPEFNGDNVPGWLYQIVRRKVSDFRRLFWIRRVLRPGATLGVDLPEPGPTPADVLDTKKKGLLLEELLGKLNPDYRAAFVMFEIQGYSGEEIADIQGVCLNTVWARIHKARKQLKERIGRLENRGVVRVT
jgi:RNA polymerase sigma-70 factor (ECF subfamily)